MPAELEERILRHAAPALLIRRHQAQRRKAFASWGALFAGASMAVFAWVFLARRQFRAPHQNLAYNEEFLDNLELFRHMELLGKKELLEDVIEART